MRAYAYGVAVVVASLVVTTQSAAGIPPGLPLSGLKITGTARDKSDMLSLLARLTKQRLSFEADGETVKDEGDDRGVPILALKGIKDLTLANPKTTELRLLAGPAEFFVDEFDDPAPGATTIDGAVDMDDIRNLPKDVEVDRDGDGVADGWALEGTWRDTNGDGIPETPAPGSGVLPHGESQASALAHILGERYFAINNATTFNDYDDRPGESGSARAHQNGGVRFGDAVKGERLLDATRTVAETGVKEKDARGSTIEYSDGSKETFPVEGGAIKGAPTYSPAPQRQPKESSRGPNRTNGYLVLCVVEPRSAPTTYSGRAPTFHPVRYRVLDVVEGTYRRKRITLHHAIVRGKHDVDPVAPQLLPDVFRLGTTVSVRTTFVDSALHGPMHIAYQAVAVTGERCA